MQTRKQQGNPIKAAQPLLQQDPTLREKALPILINNNQELISVPSHTIYTNMLIECLPLSLQRYKLDLVQLIQQITQLASSSLCTPELIFEIEPHLMPIFDTLHNECDLSTSQCVQDIQSLINVHTRTYPTTEPQKSATTILRLLHTMLPLIRSYDDRQKRKKFFASKLIKEKDMLQQIKLLAHSNIIQDYAPMLNYIIYKAKKSLPKTFSLLTKAHKLEINLSHPKLLQLCTPLTHRPSQHIHQLLQGDTPQDTIIYKTYHKLASLQQPPSVKELASMERLIKMAQSNSNPQTLSSISQKMMPWIINYVDRYTHLQVENLLHLKIGLEQLAIPYEQIATDAFINTLATANSIYKNKAQALNLLKEYALWNTYPHSPDILNSYPYTLNSNQKFLKKLGLQRTKIRLQANQRVFDTWPWDGLTDGLFDQQISEIAQKLRAYMNKMRRPIDTSDLDPQQLTQLYDKNRWIRSSQLQKLELHEIKRLIDQIKKLQQRKKGYKPQELYMHLEFDPIKIADIWNIVEWSCLSADGANNAMAFINAIDANRGVLSISDENGNFLGRVIIAITNRNRLIRYRFYSSWKYTRVDIDKFIDTYLKDLAHEMDIKTNIRTKNEKVQELCIPESYIEYIQPIT